MILVTGADGLLGSKLTQMGAVGTYHKASRVDRGFMMDITKEKNVRETIRKSKPSVVVHCAAITDVDYCEDHAREAWLVNAKGTENVAMACKAFGAVMIYVSTDFVFDGSRGHYNECDIPLPTCVYSLTKLTGEYITLGMDGLVCRTSVLYGRGSQKFVPWVIDTLNKRNKIKIVTDQYSSPTLNTELAECIMHLAERAAASKCKGIYHTAGSERISRYAFAKNIARTFNLDSGLIEPVTSNDISQRVTRPRDSSLDTGKIRRAIGYKFSGTTEGLKKMKVEIEGEGINLLPKSAIR